MSHSLIRSGVMESRAYDGAYGKGTEGGQGEEEGEQRGGQAGGAQRGEAEATAEGERRGQLADAERDGTAVPSGNRQFKLSKTEQHPASLRDSSQQMQICNVSSGSCTHFRSQCQERGTSFQQYNLVIVDI